MSMGLNKSVEEIVRTSAFLAKLKYKDKEFGKSLKNKYLEDVNNYENTLLFIFYNWFLAKHDETINQYNNESSFAIMNDIVEAIDNILEVNEKDWLVRVLKNRMDSFGYENEDAVIEDLEKIIKIQNDEYEKDEPYGIIPYLLLSEIYYSKCEKDIAKDYLNKIESMSTKKIMIIPDFFKGFFKEYRNKLKISREDYMVKQVSHIENIYF